MSRNWRSLPYLTHIEQHRDLILTGVVLAIDPSVGSTSSLPGYAVYEAGELLDSGTISIDLRRPLNERLQELAWKCKTLRDTVEADILIIEHITKFGRLSVDSLLKGVGAILAAVDQVAVAIEIPPAAWHRLEPPGYYKTDEQDAIALGYFAVQKAKGVPDRADRASNQQEGIDSRLRTLRNKRTGKKTKKSTKTSTTRSTKATRRKLGRKRRVRSSTPRRRG